MAYPEQWVNKTAKVDKTSTEDLEISFGSKNM
jgi:hypothetical protein